MGNGTLHKLGTLYVGGSKKPRPTKPWRTNSTPPGAPSAGDTPAYSAGQNIEIRNTDASDAYQIQWREVNVGDKKLLLADRNLLVEVSWDDLNAQGLIFGKEVTIDGQKYLLRVLTAGSNRRNGDYYAGGTPTNNEWDRIIVNEGGFAGLPSPAASDLDNSANETDFNSAHNKYWNWFYIYSWGQETYAENGSYRAVRGGSARYWINNASSLRGDGYGWRPVLEVLNSAPLISGSDQNLGNKTAPFSVDYSVSEPDGDGFTIVEKLNGATVETILNPVGGQTYQVTISSEQWAALPLNQASTITIEATDSNNAKSVRTYTFTKTNSAPTAAIVEPKGDLVNIAIVDTITPVLVFQFQDSDTNDVQTAFEVVIEDTNGNVVHGTGKVASTQSFFQVPDGKLTWGTDYKWKVRVWDKFDVASNFTFEEFFLPNRAPNATDVQPGSSDPNAPAGSSVAPEVTWTFSDLDLEAQAAYQVKIYRKSDDFLVYNTNRINKNLTKHEIPAGTLQEGTDYYSIVTVWDINNLSNDSQKSYFRTNATPTAPTQTFPVDMYRTGLNPAFGAIIGTDAENNAQHFVIEIAEDAAFTQSVLSFSSSNNRAGWQVSDGSTTFFDIPESGVNNSYQGRTVRYTSQVNLEEGKTYYWRMAAIDASTGARGKWSSSRSIRCGNTLQFTLVNPIDTGEVAARRILIALDYLLPTDGATPADFTIEVSNNTLDIDPTWEDATAQFLNADFYNFTNSIKTAENFALNVRVTFNANDSLDPVEVRGLGFSFD